MRNWTRSVILVAASLLTLSSAGAVAFPKLRYWHKTASSDQAGAAAPHPSPNGRAIYYTGGARDYNLTCAHCHIKGSNPVGLIGLTVTPTPAWQNVNNQKAYKPGQQYDITVVMTGEHLFAAANKPGDNGNGMNLTFEDAGGNTKGVYQSDQAGTAAAPFAVSTSCALNPPAAEPATGSTWLYGDCHGVLFVSKSDNTSWKFKWTAPAAGTGNLTMFYSGVDGDHKEDDCLNDDVVTGSTKLIEGS